MTAPTLTRAPADTTLTLPDTAPRPLRRLPLPVGEPLPAHRVPILRSHGSRASMPGQLEFGLEPAQPEQHRGGSWDSEEVGALPDPSVWAAQFVVAAVEVAAGVRSPAQLLRWTTLDVHGLLARRAALSTRLGRGRPSHGRPPLVRAVRVCTVREGVVEVAAVVADHGRVRAVALRMEGDDGRWRATALELGR